MDSLILRLRHDAASVTEVMLYTSNVGRLCERGVDKGLDVGDSDALQCSTRHSSGETEEDLDRNQCE